MLLPAEKALFFKSWNYAPNDLQRTIHDAPERIVLLAGGERAGKSFVGANDLAAEAAADPGLYWIVGPDYAQARPEFNYVVDALTKIDALADVSMPKEGSCQMILRGGCIIQTKSGEDAVKLASFAPKGILMVEAAQQSFENFQKLANRTAEARAWLRATGTFESSLGWYADMWEVLQKPDNIWGGKSISLPTWSNTAIFPGGETDSEILRLKATNDPDVFLERFGGVPCPPKGLVFREFRYSVHVAEIAFATVEVALWSPNDATWYLPNDSRTELWVDPGYAGAYAVEFVALSGSRAFVFDEVYAVGQVAETVIEEVKQHRDGFNRVTQSQRKTGIGGVIDIAARAHASSDSQEEVWRRAGGIIFRAQPTPVVDGIHRHHTFLSDPLTQVPRLIHSPKCKGAIKEYGLYRYPNDSPGRNERALPIDKHNHAMKAFAYGLVANFGFVDPSRVAPLANLPQSMMEQTVERVWESAGRRKKETGWLS